MPVFRHVLKIIFRGLESEIPKFQSEIPRQYNEKDSGWLKCNTDPKKTSSIFVLQEQMVETRAWEKK